MSNKNTRDQATKQVDQLSTLLKEHQERATDMLLYYKLGQKAG